MRKRSKSVTTGKHKTGKAMIGWWSETKECGCNKNPCNRPGGAACVRRTKRVKK